MKRVILIVLLLAILLGALYKMVGLGYIRFNYPSFNTYPIHGIDVSHHQGSIAWEKIEKDYVQFAFIKSTEGITHQDRKFGENWAAAKALQIPASAYHFFTFCTSGAQQAQNYINTVPYDSISLPPALDLEYGGNCKEENRLNNLEQEILDFIQIVEAHYKKRIIIYATRDFYEQHIKDKFLDNPIWIRDIISEPQLENNRPWLFWQYTNRGRLSGIETLVDINIFGGTKEELSNLQNTEIKNVK